MSIQKVSELDKYLGYLSKRGKVVVDFSATWCGPCKVIHPEYERLAHMYEGQIFFMEVDVEEGVDIATRENVSAMPTFITYYGGEEVSRMKGANPQNLREMIGKLSDL